MSPAQGKLYVVATPIGNLSDLSPRAKEVLTTSSALLTEDTRHAGLLLGHFGIPKKKLISYHDHNEKERCKEVVEILLDGQDLALISDAGTPLISDPGYRIVNACRARGISVISVPGPCAAIAALSISGLPTNRFIFEGFLPPKGEKRKQRVRQILANKCTSILYESKYKLLKLLEEIVLVAPDRHVVIARELTKIHEEVLNGTSTQLLEILRLRGELKGEIVVIIAPSEDDDE